MNREGRPGNGGALFLSGFLSGRAGLRAVHAKVIFVVFTAKTRNVLKLRRIEGRRFSAIFRKAEIRLQVWRSASVFLEHQMPQCWRNESPAKGGACIRTGRILHLYDVSTEIGKAPAMRSATFAFVLLSVTAMPALAAETSVDVIGVAPLEGGNYQTRQTTVSYGDLDPATPAGAETLLSRIKIAAESVCGKRSRVEAGRIETCRKRATHFAVKGLDLPKLTEAASR